MSCRVDCPLRGVQREVPYSGNKSAIIGIVGESPGLTEERLGKPFVGAAGEVLSASLLKAGINPDDVYLLNSARCRLHKDELSVKDINRLLANCRPKLEQAIRKLKPRVLVLLGDVALRQVGKLKGISKVRGNLIWNEEFSCFVYPTYHPAACLYNRSLLPILQEDLNRLRALVNNNFEDLSSYSITEVASIRELLDSDVTAVSLDTETQGLDWSSSNSLLISYSIAIEGNRAFQIYIHERSTSGKEVYWQDKKGNHTEYYKKSKNFNKKLDELRELLESDIKLYMMNGNYDVHHINTLFRRYNRPVPRIRRYAMDIQAAAHLLDENLYAQASLEQLRKSFTHITSDYSSEFELKFNKSNMLAVPKDELTYYAGMDAIVTYNAAVNIRRELLKSKKLTRYFSKFVMPAISKTLFTMEENGVLLDLAALPKAKEHIANMTETLHAETVMLIPPSVLKLHEGKDISLKRTVLIRDTLFSEAGFKLDPPKLTKKNNVSVDNETRIKLDSKNIPKPARMFLDSLNKWSKYNKLHTTYIPNLIKYVKDDQRIHPSLTVTTVVTGRSSSRSPNLQNIPKKGELAPHIRRLLVAPKGHVLMAFDASQAELRLCAAHSKDKNMLNVYMSGGDIHSTTALSILGRKREEVFDAEFKDARRSAKCFHPDTEVLTKDGWLPMRYLTEHTEIIQATPTDGVGVELSWTLPSFFELRKNHTPFLVNIQSENVGIQVTPDHRMLIQRQGGKFEVVTPLDFPRASYFFNAGNLQTPEVGNLEEKLIRLMVAVQADGNYSHHKIRFGFYKERKISRLLSLLEDGDYMVSQHKNGSNHPVTAISLSRELSAKVKTLLSDRKMFTWDILLWPLESRRVFLDELQYWDSWSHPEFPVIQYTTKHKENCDIIQAVCSVSNYKSKISSFVSGGRCYYKLSLKDTPRSCGTRDNSKSGFETYTYPYDKDVAVLSVSSTFVLVRSPEGSRKQTTLIVGQCTNFSFIYGGSTFGFRRQSKVEYGIEFSEQQAQSYMDAFFSTYPGVARYHDEVKSFCRKHGYVESLLGRKRRLLDIKSEDSSMVRRAERQALNHAIQSLSSDLILFACNTLINNNLLDSNEIRMILFIHDEIIFEVVDTPEMKEKYFGIVKNAMENPPLKETFGIELGVPLIAECKTGYNLYDMEDYNPWLNQNTE